MDWGGQDSMKTIKIIAVLLAFGAIGVLVGLLVHAVIVPWWD